MTTAAGPAAAPAAGAGSPLTRIHGSRGEMSSSDSSRRSRAAALNAASAYLKTSHIDASRRPGSVERPLDHVNLTADRLATLHRWRSVLILVSDVIRDSIAGVRVPR